MELLGKGFANKNDKIKNMRRADNFSKMAVSASVKACADFETLVTEQNISIILATQFGPHVTTFKFLDNLLDYSENSVSPTMFSHSVHNAAASYIASTLGIFGQALTITSFIDPLKQAFVLADGWLKTGQTDNTIICYVEEESAPFTESQLHCKFPSYSKNVFTTGAAAVVLKNGNQIKIPNEIKNPFTFIEDL